MAFRFKRVLIQLSPKNSTNPTRLTPMVNPNPSWPRDQTDQVPAGHRMITACSPAAGTDYRRFPVGPRRASPRPPLSEAACSRQEAARLPTPTPQLWSQQVASCSRRGGGELLQPRRRYGEAGPLAAAPDGGATDIGMLYYTHILYTSLSNWSTMTVTSDRRDGSCH